MILKSGVEFVIELFGGLGCEYLFGVGGLRENGGFEFIFFWR